jgi:REP element-mobilizing transposase RayT
MARQPRKHSSTGIYHILIRGIDLRRIFEDDEDRLTFLDHLRTAKYASGASLLAFCLMENHVHLIIEQGDERLGETMKRLCGRYASWFNMKYGRSGHLFQDRYKSEAVESDAYLVTVLRYVYNNPVKAGLCASARDYAWSGCRLLGGKSGLIDAARLAGFCDVNVLLSPEPEIEQNGILDVGGPPRRGKTDAAVAKIMLKESNAETASAFQAIEKERQILAVRTMLANGASIRQTARVTGLKKGLVESWARSAKLKR